MGTLEEPVNNKIVEHPTVSTTESVKTNETIVDKSTNNDEEVRFSGKVTPEQELSASVARRRRDISKKRSASVGRPRDQTPVRVIASDDETQVNEIPNLPPKTPERRNKSRSSRKTSLETTDVGTDPTETKTNAPNERSKSKSTRIGTPDSVDRSSRQGHASTEEPSTPTGRSKSKSTRKPSNETPENQPDTTERLGRPTHGGAGDIISNERSKSKTSRKPSNEISEVQPEKTKPSRQASSEGTETGATERNEKADTADKPPKSASADEMSSRAAKAKLSDSSKEKSARLRKDVRKVAIKRSQSAPRAKIEDICPPDETDLVESFKKAQQISADLEKIYPGPPILSESEDTETEHFSTALEYFPTPEKKAVRPTSIPIVSNILRRRQFEESEIQVVEDENEEIVEVKKPIVKQSKRYSLREIWQRWKSFKLEYSHHYKQIISMRNRCLNDIGLLMIFCGLGALMFKFTEGSFENFYKCGVKRVKRNFIDDLWRGSHHLREEDWKSMARNKLRDFEEQLHSAHEAGVTSYSGQRSWSFLNAVVYALTVVTTIGYGHMYPTTTTGRALTIIYAIIGIPLFLIILTDFGKLFTRAIKFLWAFVRRLYYTGTCKQARKNTAMQEVMKGAQMMYDIATFRRPSQYNLDEEIGGVNGPPVRFPAAQPQPYPMTLPVAPRSKDGDTDPPTTPAPSTFEIDDEFNLPISVAIFLLLGYIFLGAVVYYMWEKWDFFASFYFVFISMSTIGFGDYVPRHPICMIVSIIYLVFGLALMSMCINVVQVKISDTFKQASAKLGATIGLRVAEEDGSIATIPPPAIEIADVHTTAAKTV